MSNNYKVYASEQYVEERLAGLSAGSSSTQPDWMQDDETAADYVKNRTHYETTQEVLLEEQTITTESYYNIGKLDYPFNQVSFEIGKYYRVVYDGTVYELECVKDIYGDSIVGNKAMYNSTSYNEGDVPFTLGSWLSNDANVTVIRTSTPGDHTVSIAVFEVEKLDEKFIPNSLIEKIDGAIGKNTKNKTYTVDGSSYYGSDNCEIFNNYSNNIAAGSYSHAEGNYTKALGYDGAHAEGYQTQAIGWASHAEGSGTIASGNYSHSEGYQTEASDQYAHAEGQNSKATNDCAHAEGYYTEASGYTAHAEGQRTKAQGSNSHAEGYYTTASGGDSHAEGSNTTASGAASHTEGSNTQATDGQAHAEGYNTKATRSQAHAEGNGTEANGYYSHAEGNGTKAEATGSHAEGNYTTASGSPSHAEGNHTTASGASSHAEGYRTTASNSNAHSEGEETTASGYSSHAEGYKTIASANYSHAEGRETEAKEYQSHAEGMKTIASGESSHAEGNYSKASGRYSHSEGNYTTAYGENSHAEGSNTVAYGNCSHAEGDNTKAYGDYSHVQGQGSIANSAYLSVGGTYNLPEEKVLFKDEITEKTEYIYSWSNYYLCSDTPVLNLETGLFDATTTAASGNSNLSEGLIIAYSSSNFESYIELLQKGSGNDWLVRNHKVVSTKNEKGKYIHMIGNGESEDARSNAHTIDWSGNAWYAGSVESTSIILSSPNGTRFSITIGDDGVLSANEIVEEDN